MWQTVGHATLPDLKQSLPDSGAVETFESPEGRLAPLFITGDTLAGRPGLIEYRKRAGMNMDRKVVHTRHVLAVKDLKIEADYYKDKLGFDLDFTAPGWEFLSFGDFKVMLGECADEMTADETGNHSWFAHALVENVDDVYQEFIDRGATILSGIENKPWGIRDFSVVTPDGHRITFGQVTERETCS